MKQQAWNFLFYGGGALVVSAAARALPEPSPMGSKLYQWFFNFAHILLSNYDKISVGSAPRL